MEQKMSEKSHIYVTSSFLPPREMYEGYVNRIWETGTLTNNGSLVQELEQLIQDQLNLSGKPRTVSNGSLGLHLILKAMGGKGEIITTPFSYIATTSVPLWEGYDIVYADIEENSLTIDPIQVEALITPKTSLILATHVYGNVCDVERLEQISNKYNIPVIYDAAHAYGVTYNGKSVLEYGAASMVSLHATKIVHTGEGGIIYANEGGLSNKLEWMRRFGHDGPHAFHGLGTNAKMSELHAAMGLSVLPYFSEIKSKRKLACELYDSAFSTHPIQKAFSPRKGSEWNYAYYPVLFESETELVKVLKRLEQANIYPRRYFFPSLAQLDFGCKKNNVPVADALASRIVCLPLHSELSEQDIIKICDVIY